MRSLALPFATLFLAACAFTNPAGGQPSDRCESSDCFNQAQVRNFEILDPTTLVVYVGNQNCPFLVEFTGSFCDLTFLPGGRLEFRNDSLREELEPDARLTRVCARDMGIGIDEGPFSTAPGGEDIETYELPCRIRDIASLTDDELLELYVEKGITAPPPPFGTGEITVPDEDPAAGAGQPEATDAATPGADTEAETGSAADTPPDAPQTD
jgi:hypothetical protein